MASITIRNLEDSLKSRLRVRAASHGISMEEEVREILRITLVAADAPPRNLADAIRHRLREAGGVDLTIAPRDKMRQPPNFIHNSGE